jgi:hypothetical protein
MGGRFVCLPFFSPEYDREENAKTLAHDSSCPIFVR